jgi:16S rRNA (cytosine967-C5)-methyltransferase
MAKKNTRFIAIEALCQLKRGTTPLPVLFQRICNRYQVHGNDRALAMNLIYGVLRNYQYLDSLITRLCRKSIKKLDPLVQQGLAVGLYQLIFLSRIPDSAAVNETVNGIKATRVPKRLHGFVNGVLRESIRQRDTLPQPEDNDDDNQQILNHPSWLTARWTANFGREEMHAICRQNNQQQPLVLRVNADKLSRDDYLQRCEAGNIAALPCTYAPDGVILPQYQGAIPALPGFAEDFFQVQGEAAQLATLLLQPFQQEGHYLDGCAGLGGKTGHLLQLLNRYQATLTAVEPEPQRQEKLAENLKDALAHKRLTLFKGSLQDYCQHSPSPFNGILLDAPCSGTGVIGRQPDIRWRRTSENIERYASIQLELLEAAAPLLSEGGILVYATCSLEPEENQEVITTFLAHNPQYLLTDCASFLPADAVPLIREGFFQPRPSDALDGFFAARLVRRHINA